MPNSLTQGPKGDERVGRKRCKSGNWPRDLYRGSADSMFAKESIDGTGKQEIIIKHIGEKQEGTRKKNIACHNKIYKSKFEITEPEAEAATLSRFDRSALIRPKSAQASSKMNYDPKLNGLVS
jgi:hypothetical protein